MDDLDALKPSKTAKTSGSVGLLVGVFTCILAAQTLSVLRGSLQFPISGVMFSLGLVITYAGYRVTRGSGKAALIAIVAGAINILTTGGWFVFALSKGMLSLLAFVVLALSIACVAMSSVVLPGLRRVDAARARLRAEGLDTGL